MKKNHAKKKRSLRQNSGEESALSSRFLSFKNSRARLDLSSRGSSTRGWGKRGEELEGERIRSLPAPTTFPFGNDITSVIDRWRKVDGIPFCFFFDDGSVEL